MKNIKNKFNVGENDWIISLVFGFLIILRNFIWVNYKGYEMGTFYYAMNFVGAIAIIYGLFKVIIKKWK